jgi:hypothetical protein
MTYHRAKHRGADHSFLHFVVFPIRDANFVEIEHQVGYTAMYGIVQILDCSLSKPSGYLRALLFLGGAFCLDNAVRMSKNQGIHLSSSKFHLKFSRTIIYDFCFRDWSVLSCVMSNSIADLLFAILVEGGMLSSLPWLV